MNEPDNGYDKERNKRILVIDDNRAIHEDFRKILLSPSKRSVLADAEAVLFDETPAPTTANEFHVESAYQGQEGLALVQKAVQGQQPFAVAFVDVRMPPGWDGVETTQHLWKVDPDLQIVICTAYSDYSWDEMIDKVGNSDRLLILKKPFDTVEVLQLANALSEKWWLLQRVRGQLTKLESMVAERTRELQTANEQLQTEVGERKQAERVLQIKTEQLQIITEAMVTFLQDGDWRTSSSILLRGALSQTGSDRGFVGVVVDGPKLRILAQEGIDWRAPVQQHNGYWEISDFKNSFGDVIGGRKAIIIGESQPATVLPAGVPSSPHFLAAPVISGDEVVGIIGIANRPGGYSGAELEKIEILTRAAGILYDSYRRQQRETSLQEQLRQSQKVEAIGQLAGGIAHDFNNILTAIIGYSELILTRTSAGDLMRPNAEQILKAAHRAASLTRQLLAFSRRQILTPKVVNLNDIIGDLMKMLRRMINESVELNYVPGANLGAVKVDPGQLEQVIINLAVNARDAMPKGGQLTVETASTILDTTYAVAHEGVSPGQYVMLTVRDTGTGMTLEVRNRLFEPFFTTKEQGKGTGLGLATCYGIIKQSGGHITVESEHGHGTAFTIYLPCVEGEATTPVGEEPVTHQLPTGHETVLLAEDEPALCELAGIVLRSLGYTVLEASSGIEALKIAQAHNGQGIDLLVTDVVMPQMDGKELADHMRATNPDLKVLFSSGYTSDTIVHHGVLDEGIAFLAKPYSTDALARKIRAVLDAPQLQLVG